MKNSTGWLIAGSILQLSGRIEVAMVGIVFFIVAAISILYEK